MNKVVRIFTWMLVFSLLSTSALIALPSQSAITVYADTSEYDIPGYTEEARLGTELYEGDWMYRHDRHHNDAGEEVSRIVIYDYTGSKTEVTPPTHIGGYRVYSVALFKTPNSTATKISVPKGIKRLTIENYSKLNELILNDDLEELGIYNCESLTEINLPKNLKAIWGIEGLPLLKELKLNEGLETIKRIGKNCDSLQRIILNDKLLPSTSTINTNDLYAYNPFNKDAECEIIVSSSSKNYKRVDDVIYSKDGSILYYYPRTKSDVSYSVPNGVKIIADEAFSTYQYTSLNTNLKEISLPNTLEVIGQDSFYFCSIKDIIIPDSVTWIRTSAFAGSTIQNAIIGKGAKDLGKNGARWQFNGCEELESVVFKDGIEILSSEIFRECPELKSVNLSNTMKIIGEGAFVNCYSLSSIKGGAQLREIGNGAFWGTAINSFPFGTELEFISGNAFGQNNNFDNNYPAYMKEGIDFDGDYFNDYYRAGEDLLVSGKEDYEKAYEVLEKVNEERQKNNLSPLTMDKDLLENAMQRAAELTIRYNVDHLRPNGASPFTVSRKAYAENIAMGQGTAASVMRSWMKSPGHRANILHKSAKSIGIGVFYNNGVYYWTQLFGAEDAVSVVEPANKTNTRTIEVLDYKYLPRHYYVLDKNRNDNMNMDVGDTQKLDFYVTPIDGYDSGTCSIVVDQNFDWKSSNSKIVSVDKKGNITAKKAGEATITASFKDTKLKATYHVSVGKSIEEATVSGVSNKPYTGSAINQKPTVTLGDKTLTEGTDFTYTTTNNVEPGTATITITGKGNYLGKITKTFKINQVDLSTNATSAKISGISDKTYTGSAVTQKPTVTAKVGGKEQTLTKGIDYTVSYENNTEAGTATITIKGKGYFKGTISKTFKINPVSLSDESLKVAVTGIKNASYTGKAITQKPTVKATLNGKEVTLVNGTDYKLTYKNNTNVGTATVTITGKGNYSGTVSKTFKINAVDLSAAATETTIGDIKNSNYSGEAITKSITVNAIVGGKDTALTLDTDYVVEYVNNTNAGTATVKITGKGNYKGSVTETFKINPADISKAVISNVNNRQYTGKARTQTPTVKLGSTTLIQDTDYTVSYANNTEPGTATMTITGKGNYKGKATKTFKINPIDLNAEATKTSITGIQDKSYTGTNITQQITVKAIVGGTTTTLKQGTDYTVSYKDNVNTGTATLMITGIGRFSGEIEKTFKIKSVSLETVETGASVGNITDKLYEGTSITPSPVVSVKLNGKTITLNKGTDYTLSYKDNVEIGKATITITGSGNYTGTLTRDFNIIRNPNKIWYRLAGNGRYDTMKVIVDTGFTKTGGTVVIATGTGFKDALSSSGLAGLEDAPVVLTDGKTLSKQTQDVLSRLKPQKVYIAGGSLAVSREVESKIKTLTGAKVIRLAGQNSCETSAKLAIAGKGRWKGGIAIIATNKSFKDALSSAPVAYAKGYPILLANEGKSLDKSVLDALKSLGINQVIIVGGEAAVSDAVVSQLRNNNISVKIRLWGNNGVETSAAIGKWGVKNGLTANRMGVATSQNYPDALAGAALCGHNKAVLVLADDKAMLNANFPKAHKSAINRGYVFGGPLAVGDNTFKALEASTQ